MTVDFILGSASPRRSELLTRFVPEESFRVVSVDLDEASLIDKLLANSPNARFGLSSTWAANIVNQLAIAKMDALQTTLGLADQGKNLDTNHARIVVTADTIVVAGDRILGKPSDATDAQAMLRLLSGREHTVMTGLCVHVMTTEKTARFTAVEMTQVEFAKLSEDQIAWYTATGEPLDKAGAYGIQGYGSALVKSIHGCYYNVMGLPIHRLLELFEQVQMAFPLLRTDFKLLPW
ncbi:MAG: Maf family protein [Eubacteriales bacterium]|nr:Maf family protein [Eubacteriales bacterium]